MEDKEQHPNRVKFAGLEYFYIGTKTKGALYTTASATFPFAFLADGLVTRNDTGEVLGDVEGLLFRRV